MLTQNRDLNILPSHTNDEGYRPNSNFRSAGQTSSIRTDRSSICAHDFGDYTNIAFGSVRQCFQDCASWLTHRTQAARTHKAPVLHPSVHHWSIKLKQNVSWIAQLSCSQHRGEKHTLITDDFLKETFSLVAACFSNSMLLIAAESSCKFLLTKVLAPLVQFHQQLSKIHETRMNFACGASLEHRCQTFDDPISSANISLQSVADHTPDISADRQPSGELLNTTDLVGCKVLCSQVTANRYLYTRVGRLQASKAAIKAKVVLKQHSIDMLGMTASSLTLPVITASSLTLPVITEDDQLFVSVKS
jgi:hypothetical protein